jgi:signal transduction histidine kinase
VRDSALGAAVTHLPWLSPSATSLVALARPPSAHCWEQIRFDPGSVLLLARQSSAGQTPASVSCFSTALLEPTSLEEAVHLLDAGPPSFVDWSQAAVRPVYQAALTSARLASAIARCLDCCDPDNAWAAGLLVPLGWFAVAVVAPEQVAGCLHDPEWPADPVAVQRQHWGYDQAAIARRLNRRWRLPRWLAVITGHLDLPMQAAQLLGADPELFQVVQLAVGLAQRHDRGLSLPVGATPAQCAAGLGMPAGELDTLEHALATSAESPPEWSWTPPQAMPLLRDFLLLAAENRRLVANPVLESLESDLDHLHRALHQQHAGEEGRLRAAKLNSLAEFAAGAGHEINNPLAVISGQAQYLLTHEADPDRQKSLRTIVSQAQRIHLLLKELMYFARPPRPVKQVGDALGLMREVAESLSDLAGQRGVQLHCTLPDQPVSYCADPRQMRIALGCLLRNAVEAAPVDGWASLRLEMPTVDRLEWVVEDNGKGPTRLQREHLFDPFFSGRAAGRGRGLGLPTAWRLARENDGDVRFEDLPQGPTRFVLSISRATTGTNGVHPEPQTPVLAPALDAIDPARHLLEAGNGSLAANS